MTANRAVIKIAAAVVLDKAGCMLLVRKKNTQAFMQPGGKIEPGETALQSLHREMQEELGVAISSEKYLRRFCADAANEPQHTVDAEVFHVEISSEPVVGAEIEEMCWYAPDYTQHRILAPLSSRILQHLPPNNREIWFAPMMAAGWKYAMFQIQDIADRDLTISVVFAGFRTGGIPDGAES